MVKTDQEQVCYCMNSSYYDQQRVLTASMRTYTCCLMQVLCIDIEMEFGIGFTIQI